jgi:GH24 family phage-related lysozyme (muramidase)
VATIFGVLLLSVIAFVVYAETVGGGFADTVQTIQDTASNAVETVSGGVGLGSNDPIAIATPMIQGFETFSAKAYPDPPGSGKYSIAWGHQIQPGEPYTKDSIISRADGDALLVQDLQKYADCVSSAVQTQCTPQQTAAMISFCYNVGCEAFGNSTLVSLVNQGDFEGASQQFPSWIHAGGQVSQALVDRRAQEQDLFNS